ncbi:High-light-induced protein, chloroplastic [Ananas comosus]|uniref:High-light-induced protein, chloroplastic n=1 Tax=Ananas comosus TaxID=4615 RepID=A0A199W856_ANACO|nr:High-light-induced protein, chloroplastic [Ananas comosus]
MATVSRLPSTIHQHQSLYYNWKRNSISLRRATTLRVRAAKLPAGVEMPKVEPKLAEPFLGFTKTAEIWNSRAGMIGIIGTFIVELVFHKGILQMIGVDVGKGLDLPL